MKKMKLRPPRLRHAYGKLNDNNEQNHSQNEMANIFSSAVMHHVHAIIAVPLHFLRLPLSLICFYVALKCHP